MTSWLQTSQRLAIATGVLALSTSAALANDGSGFRGLPNTQYAGWDNFTQPFMAPNFPDVMGSTSPGATIVQTTPGAIITTTMNIYNPGMASHFDISDSVDTDLQEVVLRMITLGNPPDNSSMVLSYVDGGGMTQFLLPTQLTPNALGASPFAGIETTARFDMTGVTDLVTSFTISFDASAGNMSLSELDLDSRDVDSSIGTNYCPANVNSTGLPAHVDAFGSPMVGMNLVRLRAQDLPANQFGFFLNSLTTDNNPNPGGSQGILCLGGEIGRHLDSIASSGATGSICYDVDLTNFPQPMGAISVMAGQTFHFQCWFRDQNPNSTSNYTDAVTVDFQ